MGVTLAEPCPFPGHASHLRAPEVGAEWYALRTRPRHEKVVAAHLERQGVETLLPLCEQVRLWSDRRKRVQFPLFPSYVFVRTVFSKDRRVRLLQTPGVIHLVGPGRAASPIPAAQMDSVRSLMAARAACNPYPYLAAGQRVRIRTGSLQGVEGILLRIADDRSLVVSVDLIQRSVAVRIEGYEVEAL